MEKKVKNMILKKDIEKNRPKTPGYKNLRSTKNKSKKILFEFL